MNRRAHTLVLEFIVGIQAADIEPKMGGFTAHLCAVARRERAARRRHVSGPPAKLQPGLSQMSRPRRWAILGA